MLCQLSKQETKKTTSPQLHTIYCRLTEHNILYIDTMIILLSMEVFGSISIHRSFASSNIRECILIPTKQQFQDLTKACNSHHLSASLNLVFGNDTESKIRAIIEGYDTTLNTVFLNFVCPLPAYKWLSNQQGFIVGQRRAFPEKMTDWLDNEVAGVIQQTEENLKLEAVSHSSRKTLLRKHMLQVSQRMQSSTQLSKYI